MNVLIVIKAAAIKQDETVYWLPQPNRHCNVITYMVDCGVAPPIRGVQGFITEDGTFVNREEAFVIAKANNQIKLKHGPHTMLFSEDIW